MNTPHYKSKRDHAEKYFAKTVFMLNPNVCAKLCGGRDILYSDSIYQFHEKLHFQQ